MRKLNNTKEDYIIRLREYFSTQRLYSFWTYDTTGVSYNVEGVYEVTLDNLKEFVTWWLDKTANPTSILNRRGLCFAFYEWYGNGMNPRDYFTPVEYSELDVEQLPILDLKDIFDHTVEVAYEFNSKSFPFGRMAYRRENNYGGSNQNQNRLNWVQAVLEA